jgi:hypothetical protein
LAVACIAASFLLLATYFNRHKIENRVRYITLLMLLILGLAAFRSAPGPIIPYLHRRAKNPEDFARGLKMAMRVRRALGLFMIAFAILMALKVVG